LIFLVMFEDLPVSVVLVILYGIIMGIQVVVFILRSRWEYRKSTLHVIRVV
jgi:chitin synthase